MRTRASVCAMALLLSESFAFQNLGLQFISTRRLLGLSQRDQILEPVEPTDCPPGYYLDSVKGCCKALGPLGRASQAVETTGPLREISNRITSLFGMDKSKLTKLGIPFVLSYSFISTVNGSISLAVSWYLCCSRTGLSPLIAGQWKELLKSYGTIYAIIQLLRPFRVAAAVAMSKLSHEMLELTQEKIHCSKRTAIFYQYCLGWVVWAVTSVLGVLIASQCSGVPILP